MKYWVKRNYYRWAYRKNNIEISKNVFLDRANQFEGCNVIGENSTIYSSKIGLATYISPNSMVKEVIIGRFCSIGKNLVTNLGLHPSGVFVSTHPSFFSTGKQSGFSFVDESIFEEHKYVDQEKKYVVEIGNDVWIGDNVTIMDGIKIGDGAIIGTGAIVTKDVLPYAIVTGIPATLKRFRFTGQQIEKLLLIKWWNWDFERIKTNSHLFNDIDLFVDAIDTE